MELCESETDLVRKIARRLDLKNYQVSTTPGSSKGNNFLGIIKAVSLKNEEESVNLILKVAPTGEKGRLGQPTKQLYSREAFMYQNVFTEFKKFQEEENIIKPFDCYVKFYDANLEDYKECIVLENLCSEGYEMSDKTNPMSKKGIQAILLNYAKFHAVSLAMKRKRPKTFEKLSKNVSSNIFDMEKFPNASDLIAKVVSNAFEVANGNSKIVEELKFYQANIRNVLNYDPSDEENLAIVHFDCWCNNFLFKESNNEKYPLVKIIDWQLSILTSPAFDVAYFLIINASEDVLHNHHEYLRFYYKALTEAMKDFNLELEEIFPYNLLEKHFKKHIKHGFYISLMILKLTLCEQNESLDAKTMDFTDFMNFETKNLEFYHKRISYLVQFMHKNGLFL